MRKIAANYIFLPGYPMVKNGYVILEDKRVVEVIDTGGVMKEIQGLEFYGGMIVGGGLTDMNERFKTGEPFLPFLTARYLEKKEENTGLFIIKGAGLSGFIWLSGTVVERLV